MVSGYTRYPNQEEGYFQEVPRKHKLTQLFTGSLVGSPVRRHWSVKERTDTAVFFSWSPFFHCCEDALNGLPIF